MKMKLESHELLLASLFTSRDNQDRQWDHSTLNLYRIYITTYNSRNYVGTGYLWTVRTGHISDRLDLEDSSHR